MVKDLSAFHPGQVVADAVYTPVETRLLKETRADGCTCINGKGMLLWQGVAGFKPIMGQDMPVKEVKVMFFSRQTGRAGDAALLFTVPLSSPHFSVRLHMYPEKRLPP